MATDGPDPKPCNSKIFKKGQPIALIDGASNAVERFVQAVAEKAKAKVDWHYSGGVAQVLFLGSAKDRARIGAAIDALAPELKGEILQRLGDGDKGRYRAI